MTDKNYGTWSEFAKEGLDEMEQAAIDAHCESVMMEQEEAQAKADAQPTQAFARANCSSVSA